MKKIILVFGILFLVLLARGVSASLCKGDDGYYHDCSSYFDSEKVTIENKNEWEDKSDGYNQCLDDCDRKYSSSYYSKNVRNFLRSECYDLCTEKNSYSERVEYSENIQDLRDSYKESYEYKVEILDEQKSLWSENRNEVIYLGSYEYKYEKPYFSRDYVVYVNPYRDYAEKNKVIYLDGSGKNYDYNRAGYGYKYTDSSDWRYKEPYVWSDYQECECEEWSWGKCQEWECDNRWNDYYYKPRLNSEGVFNWRW